MRRNHRKTNPIHPRPLKGSQPDHSPKPLLAVVNATLEILTLFVGNSQTRETTNYRKDTKAAMTDWPTIISA